MTKQEELKLLEQIEGLINSAGADSYIALTFEGVTEVCRNNIRDDFGNSPVRDCYDFRSALDAEVRNHDQTKRLLADSQKMCKESMDEVNQLRKRIKEVEDERDALADSINDHMDIFDKQERIVRQLLMKASAEMYTNGGDARHGYIRGIREVAEKIFGMEYDAIQAVLGSVNSLEYVDISILRKIAEMDVENIKDWSDE